MAKFNNPAKAEPAPVEINPEPIASPAKAEVIEPAKEEPAVDQEAVQDAPVLPRFSLMIPSGEVFEFSAATIEDAIRRLNPVGPAGKVYPRKQLVITELK